MMTRRPVSGEQDYLLESSEQLPTHCDYDAASNPLLDARGHPQPSGPLPLGVVFGILSTSFVYGCILTTLFLITLPVECERIHSDWSFDLLPVGPVPKSVALGVFVSIAGTTQLISPLVGSWSDSYQSPTSSVGQRIPYYLLGALTSILGLSGQLWGSTSERWLPYTAAFACHMIGINIQYGMMLAILADQVPADQVGIANGVLAFLLVLGSLVGFGLFHTLLHQDVTNMYVLYLSNVVVASVLTWMHAHKQDAVVAIQRKHTISSSRDDHHDMGQNKLHRDSLDHRMVTDGGHVGFVQWTYSFLQPIREMSTYSLLQSYHIDINQHHDFFVVTVSRLFYYTGSSVQTFFLYFLHDCIRVRDNPEAAVARLAMLGQLSGAFVCYPMGIISDRCCSGRRRPFVYVACVLFAATMVTMIFARSMEDMIILSLVLGVANGIYLTMETSMAVDTLPTRVGDSSVKTEPASNGSRIDPPNNRSKVGNAKLLGIWGVAAFLGSAMGPMIAGPLLFVFGRDKDTATITNSEMDQREEYGIRGYAVILALSAVYFACSALALCFLRK